MVTLRKVLKLTNLFLGVTLCTMGVCQIIFGHMGSAIFFLMPAYLM